MVDTLLKQNAAEVSWVIGVDGGGTKTEAVLAVLDSRSDPEFKTTHVVATQVTGPSNLQRLPLASSLAEVTAACNGLFDRVPAARNRVVASCFAMAGSGNPLLKAAFERWVKQQPWGQHTLVTHDARAVVAAGSTADAGIALIAGTGSFAFGLTDDGREASCGGWGGLLGDEGGAYWIALQGFRHALQAVDGRGPTTCLIEDLTKWCTDIGPQRWPHQLSLLAPQQIAAAAPVVTAAAQRGDVIANQIVTVAAKELARLVATLARRLFPDQPFQLACAGGPLCLVPMLGERLLEQLAMKKITRVEIQRVTNPACGAARIAARLATEARAIEPRKS